MSNREKQGPERPSAGREVGYCKPPMERRFKGSGNLKGRPEGAKNRKTIVKLVANEMHTVLENGKRRRRSTLELILLLLRNMALEGKNVRAFGELHRLTKTYQPQEADDRGGYLVVPADMTAEEWTRDIEKENVKARARRVAEIKEQALRKSRTIL